jgi:hypothetical protein
LRLRSCAKARINEPFFVSFTPFATFVMEAAASRPNDPGKASVATHPA